MKKCMISLCLILVMSGILMAQDNDSWLKNQKKLYLITGESELDALIRQVHRRFGTFEARMKAFAFLRVGTPYRGGCLGEEKEPDGDPLFRLDVADCTVFVLTTTALAHQPTLAQAREMMKVLNYYNPPEVGSEVVSFDNRIHFTWERLHKCPFYRDMSPELVAPSKLAKVDITLNRKSDGTKLIAIPWEKKIHTGYIPASMVNQSLMARLPGVCGVGFVRRKNFSIGVVISHEGLIVDRKWLYHANSIAGKVTQQDFLNYFRTNSDYFDGIIVSRIL